MREHRCRACGALLFRSDAEYGRLEIVCRKCTKKQTIYLGGYQRQDCPLTALRA